MKSYPAGGFGALSYATVWPVQAYDPIVNPAVLPVGSAPASSPPRQAGLDATEWCVGRLSGIKPN